MKSDIVILMLQCNPLTFCFLQSSNVELSIQKKHAQSPSNSGNDLKKSESLDEGNHKDLYSDFVHGLIVAFVN